jgi:hypothetical protein
MVAGFAADSVCVAGVSGVQPGSSWLEEDNCDKRKDADAAANPVKAQIWDHLCIGTGMIM